MPFRPGPEPRPPLAPGSLALSLLLHAALLALFVLAWMRLEPAAPPADSPIPLVMLPPERGVEADAASRAGGPTPGEAGSAPAAEPASEPPPIPAPEPEPRGAPRRDPPAPRAAPPAPSEPAPRVVRREPEPEVRPAPTPERVEEAAPVRPLETTGSAIAGTPAAAPGERVAPEAPTGWDAAAGDGVAVARDAAAGDGVAVARATPPGGGGGDRARIFGADEVDRVARPTAQPAPRYPPRARRMGREADRVVWVTVASDGRVLDAEVRGDDEGDEFAQAAVDGIRRWRFAPARREGRAVASQVAVTVRFRLE